MPHFNGKSGRYNGANTAIWTGWLNAKLYPTARWTGFIPAVPARWRRLDVRGHQTAPRQRHRNDNDFLARYGGGIDWFLTEHLYLTTDAAYLHPKGRREAIRPGRRRRRDELALLIAQRF